MPGSLRQRLARIRRPVPIRTSLARNLMAMILLTSGAILLISYAWSERVVAKLSEELISQRIARTEQELRNFFRPLENGLLMFRDWGRAGLLEAVDSGAIAPPEPGAPGEPVAIADPVVRLNARFVPLLERFSQVSSLVIADGEGEAYLLLRQPDHWLDRVTRFALWGSRSYWMRREPDGRHTRAWWRDVDYDARSRPWFRGALDTPPEAGVHWTEPYRFFTTGEPGITASLAWRDPAQPGAHRLMALDVLLSEISRFTMSLDVSPGGTALVLAEDGAVVGLPRDERFADPERRRAAMLLRARDLAVPVLDDAVRAWDARSIRPGEIYAFRSGGARWWAGLQPFALGARQLQIGVLVPERDFLAEVVRQRNVVLAVTAAALVVAFLLAVALARGYSRPLAALAAQARRIQRLELAPAAAIRSGLAEVEALAANQGQMIKALDSFSRYVPIDVVRELLRAGEVASIGGRSAHLTVLFTDIRGFTEIAEKLTPEALTAQLAVYFDALLAVLKDEKATVDKFVGDAIMAFWGAPMADPRHARHAVDAVARCRARLAELNSAWEREGRPALPTCFGLDLGPLVVGNVGAPHRLNYTVLGDTVNLASRIEGLNRRYGSEALASQAVRDAAGDDYAWRLVDRVAVKGRTGAVRIYEPLGRRGELAPGELAFAAAYEAALARYWARDFEGALRDLGALAAERPGDASLALLSAACRELAAAPPPPDWDGVTRLDAK